jgi:hypothetical protein
MGMISDALYRFFDTPTRDLWLAHNAEFRILEAGRYLWLDLKIALGGGDRYKIRVDVADCYDQADDLPPGVALDILLNSIEVEPTARERVQEVLKGHEFVEVLRFLKTTNRIHLSRTDVQRVVCKVFLDKVDFRPLGVTDEQLILCKLDLQSEGFPPDLEALEEVTAHFEHSYEVTRQPSGGPSTFEIVQEKLANWHRTQGRA